MKIYQHKTVESFKRELSRNGQLRIACGFRQIPEASVFTRFIDKLKNYEKEIEQIHEALVEWCYKNLDGYG